MSPRFAGDSPRDKRLQPVNSYPEVLCRRVVSEAPLAESLFQIYSFWMSRDVNDIPFGADGTTRFPKFWYDKFGNWDTNANQWLEDPMLYWCEKAFVVIVTDGVPTRDDCLPRHAFEVVELFLLADVPGVCLVELAPLVLGDLEDQRQDLLTEGGADALAAVRVGDVLQVVMENGRREDLV